MVYVLSAKQLEVGLGELNNRKFSTNNNITDHGYDHGENTGEENNSSSSSSVTDSDKESILKNFIGFAIFGIALIIYSGVGAWIFVKLEADDDKAKIQHTRVTVNLARTKFASAVLEMSRNCSSTEDILTLESFTKLLREYEGTLEEIAEGALDRYLEEIENPKGRWNFFHSLLFVFTLVTTIGYGNITPKTTSGRVFCVMFSLLGIPLALIEIALSGKLLAGMFLAVFGRFVKYDFSLPEKATKLQKLFGTTLSIFGVLNLLIGYTFIGAFLYDYTESWGFINSFYFCFTTLTTVGFGDLVPQAGVASGNPFAAVRVIYVLFGLALTSTSFELVRQQYSNTWAPKVPKRIKTPALYVAVQKATHIGHGHGHGHLDIHEKSEGHNHNHSNGIVNGNANINGYYLPGSVN